MLGRMFEGWHLLVLVVGFGLVLAAVVALVGIVVLLTRRRSVPVRSTYQRRH